MKFDALHGGTDCRCTDALAESCDATYVRDVGKKPRDKKWFRSKWEIAKGDLAKLRIADAADCKSVCGSKGVSLTPCADLAEFVERREERMRFAPKLHYRTHYLFVQLRPGAGVVHQDRDDHANLFKCDAFDFASHVNVIADGEYDV